VRAAPLSPVVGQSDFARLGLLPRLDFDFGVINIICLGVGRAPPPVIYSLMSVYFDRSGSLGRRMIFRTPLDSPDA